MSTSRRGARSDLHWMRRALVLARPHLAQAWPNPTVGACIVRDGRLLAEGVHTGAGEAHAEVAALRALRRAGGDPGGSTLYVTLEPCNHYGRTPPCAEAILDAGIVRVVYAIGDMNPRAPGGGGDTLRRAGLEVVEGVQRGLAHELNHPFFETGSDAEVHWTLKLALGADGTLAPDGVDLRDPQARRITGERAHRRAHRLRAGARCVIVGSGTGLADRPRLDVRHLPSSAMAGPGPRAVVLDARGRCSPELLPEGALVLHSAQTAAPRDAGGREWVALPGAVGGGLQWDAIEEALVARDLGLALVEGGEVVARSLLRNRPPHRIHLLVSPRRFRSAAARLDLAEDLDRDYRRVRARRIGEDEERVYVRRDLPQGPRESAR